jgi:hypothetical protein
MLKHGKSTPDFVRSMLSIFGNNPYGEPNFRLIWSQRKMIYFAGETVPEYAYLDPPCWVLETWTPPEKDAGDPDNWQKTTFGLLGPYPSKGTYNFVKQYPQDWQPSEETVRLVCVGVAQSKDVDLARRKEAIIENKKAEAAAARKKVAEEIVELQDSASLGQITQPVSGQKNNFRTTDDWERDLNRAVVVRNLPTKGGKIL